MWTRTRKLPREGLGTVLSLLSLVLVSCTANRMYRPESIEENPSYTLAFIEFDDQGEMWAPQQLSRALSVIERANRAEEGLLLVGYVHGWQHNASQKNEKKGGNVAGFKEFLSTIGTSLDATPGGANRELVGVYFGWRGKSGTIPGLNLLTFYGRGSAGRRVAGTSATEAIMRLLATAKENPESKTFMMGHSFGGQIMERALTQAMVGDLLGRHEKEYGLLADLVVLVNPAAKSLQAKQFVEMLERSRLTLSRTDRSGREYEVPLMVSITSASDMATRVAFPLGTSLGSMFKRFRRYPEASCSQYGRQRAYYIRTPGNNRSLLSHEVTAEPVPSDEDGFSATPVGEVGSTELDPETGSPIVEFQDHDHRFTLRRLSGAANDTPYWIVRVPGSLVPGHSGFFTSEVRLMIRAILSLTGALSRETRVNVEYDLGVEPVSMVTLGDGTVLFADESRRIYEIDRHRQRPYLWGCLPRIADLPRTIGSASDGARLVAITSQPTGESSETGEESYLTALLAADLGGGRVTPTERREISSQLGFGSAAYSFEKKTAFLVPRGGSREIYRSALTRRTSKGKEKRIEPVAESWVHLEGTEAITDLLFWEATRTLLVADGQAGTLYAVRDEGAGPAVSLLADSLGAIVGLAVDVERNVVYVGDADGHRLWVLECPGASRCESRRSLAEGEVTRPSLLTVGADGTIWIGDPEARRIVAVSDEGELIHVVEKVAPE